MPVDASRRLAQWLAVAVGGAFGTLVRYEVTLAFPAGSAQFPWAIMLVNVVGCVVVGVVMAAMRARPGIPDGVRLFVVVGVCGGLTTFSTWMVADVLLVHDGAPAMALLDVLVSLVAGMAAVWFGFRATSITLGVPRGGDVLDVREAD